MNWDGSGKRCARPGSGVWPLVARKMKPPPAPPPAMSNTRAPTLSSGTPAGIAADMRAFIDVGCSYFMLDIIGLPDEDVIRLVMDELLPEVLS